MKIKILPLSLSLIITCVYADNSTISDLTTALKNNNAVNPAVNSSTNGNLINNNVNYTQPKTVVQVSNTTTQQVQGANNICNPNATQGENTSVPKKKVIHKAVKKTTKKVVATSWAYQSFDVSYNGDISGVPEYLKQFDPSLQILPALGKKKPYKVNFDIQNAKISDIMEVVNNQTNGGAKIIFDADKDTIRISYNSKIDYSYGNDALQQSIDWQNGLGKPSPILTPDGTVLFPYGQYAPIITCKPMQVCDIAFDKGEIITDANIGDNQQWIVSGAQSGTGPNTVQHLVIKPWYDNLSTNLIVATNKGRNYAISLRSSNHGYVNMAGFYYPQEMTDLVDQKLNRLRNELKGTSDVDTASPKTIPLSSTQEDDLLALKIDRSYKISGDSPAWKPVSVFSDGQHTYIQLPKSYINSDKAPVLVGMDDNGNFEIINYAVKGNYYITDVIFSRAAMMDDINKKGDTVYITHGDTPVHKNWLF